MSLLNLELSVQNRCCNKGMVPVGVADIVPAMTVEKVWAG